MPSWEPPDTLPAKLYRGAILADLNMRDCIRDEDGYVWAFDTKWTGDEVLDSTLREICGDQPRRWSFWVRRHPWATLAAVQDQLVAAGVVAVDARRVLGLFPHRRVTMAEPVALLATVRDAALGDQPLFSFRDEITALVALAVAGQLESVLSRQERKDHADRIAACTERCARAALDVDAVLSAVRYAAYGD